MQNADGTDTYTHLHGIQFNVKWKNKANTIYYLNIYIYVFGNP